MGRSISDPNFFLSELQVELDNQVAAPVALKFQKVRADFEQAGWPVDKAVDGQQETGWAISPQGRQNHWAIFTFEQAVELDPKLESARALRRTITGILALK